MIKPAIAFVLFFMLRFLSTAQQTNIALHKPVQVSSEAPGFPAANIVDGIISRTSKWQAANGKAPHVAEIDLKKYYTIRELRIHSGLLDSEKRPDEMTQAAGFWSVKNFKMQYWDDANWSDFPKSEIHENRLSTVVFTYQPAVTTSRIRLVCDDGEPINVMELEAFGTLTPNMPEPPGTDAAVQQQPAATQQKEVTIRVTDKPAGNSMKYVGYNQGYYMPGSNTSGWLEYAGVNSLRVWASLNAFVPQTAVQVDANLSSVEEFDKRKAALRKEPENNAYIRWKQLLPLYDQPDSSSTNAMVYNYALSELERLGIDVILQIGSTDFSNDWSNKWKQWQRYYALAYYSARKGGVTMFALQNEPNHRNSGPMALDQWIGAMQVVSDAVHCAVEDVNRQYGRKLVPKFVGPVTAGQNTDWWAAISKAVRTDYHGRQVDNDLMEIFSTHSYNSPAAGYESRIDNIRKINQEAHPAGRALPIVYTEIGRWMNAYLIDKEETMDDPSLFTEWAGIYANNMKNGGYGMWAFKFANTASGPYPEGIKSGHHFVWHGRRIVEDAYTNLALGKPVTTINTTGTAAFVTDGDKSDASTWISDSTATQKWVVIDLGKPLELGSAVVYTGDASGVYTSPQRIKNFRLEYEEGSNWKTIPGTVEKDNKYAQLFIIFKSPVKTSRVRFISEDPGRLKLREIKLFARGDGPSSQPDYDVSGIQRTGEVVRLFAKGFRNEKPLLQTTASVDDKGLDHYTSYDAASGNYYMWLVQRGQFDYNVTLDMSQLSVVAGTPVAIESVNAATYGEVSRVLTLGASGKTTFTLPAQTVFLLTIPKGRLMQKIIPATHTAMAAGGTNSNRPYEKELRVQLDASHPDNNAVSYINFSSLPKETADAKQIIFQVTGKTDKTGAPYRLHVYAIPAAPWPAQPLTWNTAPLLDKKEALIREVGQKAFVAGEIAFTDSLQPHMLDVTQLVHRHPTQSLSFVLVRETRELGDDEDKGYRVIIDGVDKKREAQLIYWR